MKKKLTKEIYLQIFSKVFVFLSLRFLLGCLQFLEHVATHFNLSIVF